MSIHILYVFPIIYNKQWVVSRDARPSSFVVPFREMLIPPEKPYGVTKHYSNVQSHTHITLFIIIYCGRSKNTPRSE